MKPLTGNAFTKILEKSGWTLARIQGSHFIYTKEGHKARISVPVHGNRMLKKGLMMHLMRVAGLRDEDLR
jgi:predicted RNA binding protein YcfA (HicA-like mRNA interferase family)